ncbi:MAG TPA: LysE family translocator [bacterium]|nr:LysE family translocator [bacterium]
MEPTWLVTFLAVNFLLNVTPGPAVLQVVGHSMANGWRPAQVSILGILSANAVYCGCSALGVGAVILAAPQLFEAVKYAGTAYLAWLGISALRGVGTLGAAAVSVGPPARPSALFRQSFVLQSANPKSVLFYCAMLPVFAGAAEGAAGRIVLLGIFSFVLEYPVLLAYSLLASRVRVWLSRGRGRILLQAGRSLALLAAAGLVTATHFDLPGS